MSPAALGRIELESDGDGPPILMSGADDLRANINDDAFISATVVAFLTIAPRRERRA
jgi:hypothetical protein